MRTVLTLALRSALVFGAVGILHASEREPGPIPVRLTVTEGRVFISEPGVPPRYLARGEHFEAAGRGLFELGALGEVELAWSNQASLRAYGPVVLEWDSAPHDEVAGRPTLAWRVSALGRVEVESRRADVRLSLPGGFIARVHDAAVSIGKRPRGECVVEHRAGADVLVQLPEIEGRVLPALRIANGERARLTPNTFPIAAADRTRHAAPWSSMRWPWGGAVAASGEPSRPSTFAIELGAVTPITYAAAPSEELERMSTEPLPLAADSLPLAAVPVAEDSHALPEDPSGDEAVYRAWQWRGLPRSSLRGLGACACEAAPDLRTRALDDGAWLIALDARATAARWCLSDVSDVALEPGSVIIVDARGRLRAHWGTIRVHEATPSRPRFVDVDQALVPPMK